MSYCTLQAWVRFAIECLTDVIFENPLFRMADLMRQFSILQPSGRSTDLNPCLRAPGRMIKVGHNSELLLHTVESLLGENFTSFQHH